MLGLSEWEVARQKQRKRLMGAACKKKHRRGSLKTPKENATFQRRINSRQPRSSSAHASDGEFDGTKEEGGENDEDTTTTTTTGSSGGAPTTTTTTTGSSGGEGKAAPSSSPPPFITATPSTTSTGGGKKRRKTLNY